MSFCTSLNLWWYKKSAENLEPHYEDFDREPEDGKYLASQCVNYGFGARGIPIVEQNVDLNGNPLGDLKYVEVDADGNITPKEAEVKKLIDDLYADQINDDEVTVNVQDKLFKIKSDKARMLHLLGYE